MREMIKTADTPKPQVLDLQECPLSVKISNNLTQKQQTADEVRPHSHCVQTRGDYFIGLFSIFWLIMKNL